jgi:hypothetical protein
VRHGIQHDKREDEDEDCADEQRDVEGCVPFC